MKAPHGLLVFLAALSLSVAPALAQEHKFKIFGAASYISPLAEDDADIGGVRDSLQAANDTGWNLGFESRFNQGIGLEIDYVNATTDVEFGGSNIGEVDLEPLSATLNLHIIPKGFDLYIGPTLSYFLKGNTTEDEFAWGASLGLDIYLGDTFTILAGVRWVNVDLTGRGTGQSLSVDPLFSRVGLALRF